MAIVNVEQFYQTQIKSFSYEEQLRLIAIITDALLQDALQQAAPKRSILDLEGFGAELWHGVDTQEYVNTLRDEWDEQT